MGGSEALVVDEEGLDLAVAGVDEVLEGGDGEGADGGGGRRVGEAVVGIEARVRGPYRLAPRHVSPATVRIGGV